MNMKKQNFFNFPLGNKKLITIIALFLLIIPLVSSLGVTPGRTTINFEESLEREVKFTILNNEQRELKLAIYTRGELAEYIELPVQNVELNPGEESKELVYNIKLHAEMEEPGLHEAEIVIREISPGEGKDITISTMEAVVTQLHVYAPYPGKYVVAKLDIVGGKTDKIMRFFVPLVNFGKDDINMAKAEILIMDMQEKVINKIETDQRAVPGEGRAELSASMDPSKLLPGLYRVIARVDYDGFTTTAENSFFIKDFLLIPLDISVRDFTLGDIARFNILVENIGNIDIKNAYSLILLDSKSGESAANLRSTPIDFKPFEKKEMVSYWETEGVNEGEYTGKLVLRYEEKSDERGIRTIVGRNSITTEIVGVTGYAVTEQAAPQHSSPLVMLVILLVIVNVGWFVYYFMSRKKK